MSIRVVRVAAAGPATVAVRVPASDAGARLAVITRQGWLIAAGSLVDALSACNVTTPVPRAGSVQLLATFRTVLPTTDSVVFPVAFATNLHHSPHEE